MQDHMPSSQGYTVYTVFISLFTSNLVISSMSV